MKRERERKWYYIYGNLSERFYNTYHHKMNSLDWLLDHPKESYNFETCYPIGYDKYDLKYKHYMDILHTVVSDYFGEISEKLFDLDISTMATTEGKIYLYFNLKVRQKDEEIFIGETVEQSDGREQPI